MEPRESLLCGTVVPVQQDEGTTMPDASNSGEVLSIPVMPVDSSLSWKESTVQLGEDTLNTTVPKAAEPSESRSIPVELVESCSSDKEGPFHQEESTPSTVTPETLTSSDIHSDSISISDFSHYMEAPLKDKSTPTVTEASTCSETGYIPVVEAYPSEKKTPLHPEQRACSTTDQVASTACKCQFAPELNPFSEECTDEQGSSREGDTISSDFKQSYNEPSKTEVFVLLLRNKIARGGLLYEMDFGFRWKFLKEIRRVTKILSCGHGLKCFYS